MGRRSWRYVLEKRDGKYILFRERFIRSRREWVREEIGEFTGELRDKVLSCPYCGDKATNYFVQEKDGGLRYIWLYHLPEKQKHNWYLAKASDTWLEWFRNEFDKELTLSREDREAVKRYFLHRKGYSEEDRRRAREIINIVIRAKKIIY